MNSNKRYIPESLQYTYMVDSLIVYLLYFKRLIYMDSEYFMCPQDVARLGMRINLRGIGNASLQP